MPFPTNPPKHMPCPHWNHFPIYPEKQNAGALSSSPGSPPVSPSSYDYCTLCKAQTKK